MSRNEWESMNEMEFDSLLENSVSELPPEDVVTDVTPWKKAMNRVLIGMALSAITLNFLCLDYILPAIGMVLSILGFRTLRRENQWFGVCFVITLLRAAYLLPSLILNTTIYHGGVYASAIGSVLSVSNIGLLFALFFCLRSGLRAVQQKVDLTPHAGGAVALIVWYALLCALALIQYNGYVIAGAMIVGYIFIIRSLFKLSKELDEAGYAIQTAPARVSDRAIVTGVVAVLLVGCACGYLFGDSYDMAWEALNAEEHSEVQGIKEALIERGFPEHILNDMSAEDIAACEGAVQVLVDVHDHPVNEGRVVETKKPGEPGSGATWVIHRTTVYDVKELRITGVAVELPGERESWRIIHHFEWTTNPGFFGTESIQLWPAYNNGKGWGSAGDVTGRVLYDKDGSSYVAPYHFLGKETFTSSSMFFGESTSTDVFVAFSLPNSGVRQRGYVSYPIIEMQDGWITDAWINYTHQVSRLQYPVMTAMEKRMTNTWREAGAFLTIQDALQFYSTDDGANLLN